MKRFIVRKVKQHSYSRQRWMLKDCGYVFAIYDREWRKNVSEAIRWCTVENGDYKYIDNAHKKEVAQFWANWLNANRAEEFGHKIIIPMKIFNEGLKLYHQEESSCQV